MNISFLSRKLSRIRNLKAFFPEFNKADYLIPHRHIGVWGRKRLARFAAFISRFINVKIITIEDGFIRSVGLGANNTPPLSLIVDKNGIYYDATSTSDLENIINSESSNELLERAEKLINNINKYQITKYNTGATEHSLPEGSNILVIDQTVDDCSIKYGLANAESFEKMLEAALAENPNSNIFIKTHPDVITGKKKGYLTNFKNSRVKIVAEDINLYALLDKVSKVYTVTSASGMEALIAAKEVHCFGMPFYAGWGLTFDRVKCSRRNKKISLQHLVACVYIKYPKYVNPYYGKICEVEEVIEIINNVKNFYSKHCHNYACLGISSWKQNFVQAYLKTPTNNVRFIDDVLQLKDNEKLAVWASKAELYNVKNNALFIEDGFIRSSGLGSNFIPANSLALDESGIYYDYHTESDIEKLIQNTNFTDELIERANKLHKKIIDSQITKYNSEPKISEALKHQLPTNKKLILAIGQVEDDASIKRGSFDIKTTEQMLIEIRKNNANAFIIFKPHPEVTIGNRKGAKTSKMADLTVADVNIQTLINVVDEVHTISSLSGFEALMLHKKVYVYGMPFYAGWGLTIDRATIDRRKRKINLSELIAASLILYPAYFCFASGLPANAEIIIDKLCKTPQNTQRANNALTRAINFVKLSAGKL